MQPTPVFLGFPGGSAGKESACNVEDLGSIPGLGRSPREGKGLLQYSGLENSIYCIVYGVTKSWAQLRDFHIHVESHRYISEALRIPSCGIHHHSHLLNAYLPFPAVQSQRQGLCLTVSPPYHCQV